MRKEQINPLERRHYDKPPVLESGVSCLECFYSMPLDISCSDGNLCSCTKKGHWVHSDAEKDCFLTDR